MSASIARFLKDFGEPEAPALPSADVFNAEPPSFGDFADTSFDVSTPDPVLDVEAIKAAAFEEGRAAAVAELTEAFEKEKLELISQNVAELESLRNELTQDLGAKVGAQISETMDAIANFLADHTLSVLAPVLTDELARRASEELAQLVKSTLADRSCTKLIIRGQAPMLEAFTKALGDPAPEIHFIESEETDLSVEIEDSVVVTRMSAWASSLRKVMQ